MEINGHIYEIQLVAIFCSHMSRCRSIINVKCLPHGMRIFIGQIANFIMFQNSRQQFLSARAFSEERLLIWVLLSNCWNSSASLLSKSWNSSAISQNVPVHATASVC